MKTKRSKAEIQAEMRRRSESMSRRVDALESEVSTMGPSLRTWLAERPLAGVGGAVVAGLVAGWLVSGIGRRRRRDGRRSAHTALVDAYIDALGEDVRYATRRGKPPDVAVREALHDRVPLVVREAVPKEEAHGPIGEAFDLLVKTAFSFLVRELMDRFAEPLMDRMGADRLEKTLKDIGPVASAVSENADG